MKKKAGKRSRGEEGNSRKDDSVSALKGQAKLQKKQMKRVRFLTKIEEGGQLLSARKAELKKKGKSNKGRKALKIASLSSLADSLPSLNGNRLSALTRQGKVRQSRPSQQVVLNETKQLAAVLSDPEFQENPFLAIHRHLSNTLPEEEPKKEAAPKRSKNSKSRRKTASAHKMEE